MDLNNKTDRELRQMWACVYGELHRRKRLDNGSVVGGYARDLVCERMELVPEETNQEGFDATKPQPGSIGRVRYQIKGRMGRLSDVSVNGLPDPSGNHFDYLVVVVFQNDLTISRVFKANCDTVRQIAAPTKKNGHSFRLNGKNMAKLKDITRDLGLHHA